METVTERPRVTVKLRDDLHRRMLAKAVDERAKLSELVDAAVQQYLAQRSSSDESNQVIRN